MKHSKSIGFYLNVKEMLEKPKKGKKTPLKIPALFSIFPHYFAFFRTISRTIWQNFPHYFPFFPALYQKPCSKLSRKHNSHTQLHSSGTVTFEVPSHCFRNPCKGFGLYNTSTALSRQEKNFLPEENQQDLYLSSNIIV